MISSVKKINKMKRRSLREAISDKVAREGLFKEANIWAGNLRMKISKSVRFGEEQFKQRNKQKTQGRKGFGILEEPGEWKEAAVGPGHSEHRRGLNGMKWKRQAGGRVL